MSYTISCDYCGNQFDIKNPAAEVWRCPVCGNDVYDEIEDEDGFHYDNGEDDEDDTGDRTREY